MPDLTIGGLANAGGVGVETVRFYQRRGLLPEPVRPTSERPASGYRRYGENEVRTLRFIRSAQAAGFTLAEIKELIALDATQDRARVHALARQRISALDVRITELSAARAALARLADVCGSGSKGPCPIVEAFEAGARNQPFAENR